MAKRCIADYTNISSKVESSFEEDIKMVVGLGGVREYVG